MGIRWRQGGHPEAIAMSLKRDDSGLAQGGSGWSGVVRSYGFKIRLEGEPTGPASGWVRLGHTQEQSQWEKLPHSPGAKVRFQRTVKSVFP